MVTSAMSERSFLPHGNVYLAMGRRVGEIFLIVMQNVATEAVKPMMVLSHIGSRQMRGSSITRREVIWPIAARRSEEALIGVKSTEVVRQQSSFFFFFAFGNSKLDESETYLRSHNY